MCLSCFYEQIKVGLWLWELKLIAVCRFVLLGPRHTLQKLAAEIGTLTSMPDSGDGFACQCTASNVVDCLRVPKTVYDVRSSAFVRKPSPESGVEFRPIAPISGASVKGLKVVPLGLMRQLQQHLGWSDDHFVGQLVPPDVCGSARMSLEPSRQPIVASDVWLGLYRISLVLTKS